MKKPVEKNVISRASLLFLQRKFWWLYLHSPSARRDFRNLALSRNKNRRRKKNIRLFIKSVEEFDQRETLKLKNYYSHSRAAHLAIALIVLSSLSVAVQLFYPYDRALPFARLQANGYVGFTHKDEISAKLQDFDRRLVHVHTHNKELISSYTDLGIRININTTFDKMNHYTLKQRLTPFSIFIVGNDNFTIDRSLDQAQLKLYVDDVVAERDKKPIDAKLELKKQDVVVIPADEGFKYEKAELESQINRSDLSHNAKIVFAPTILYPEITTYTANNRGSSLKTRLNTPLVITAQEKNLRIEAKNLASWLEIEPQPEKNDFAISLNEAKINNYLQKFAKNFNYEPKPAETTLLNGLPAGRLPGKYGRSLDVKQLIRQVQSLSLEPTAEIQASIKQIKPREITIRRYSRDSLGLQTLLNHWVASNPGDYSIEVRDLNGRIYAAVNPNQHYSAVGIYRLFLASMIYSKITADSLSGFAKTSTGSNVNRCIDKMIYESHIGCSNALGDIAGWGSSDSFLNAQGFGSTTLVKGASMTTASDAADWVEKLYNRSITTDSQAGTLLSIMSRQIGRMGIPAGTPGIRVDNKTGSFGRLNHDVGLIYHPKGKYIVAIMSQDSGFSRIADLSREIEKVFDQ